MSARVSSSTALPIAYLVLRVLIVLNWLWGVAIIALLVAAPTRQWIMRSLDLSPSAEADRVVMGFRVIAGIGLVTIPLLSAIGIFLGRVARYNSWDILTDPRGILHSSRTAMDSLRIVKIVGSMWLALIVVHQFYKVFHDGLRFRLSELRKYRAELRARA